jgi:hypothetical protein
MQDSIRRSGQGIGCALRLSTSLALLTLISPAALAANAAARAEFEWLSALTFERDDQLSIDPRHQKNWVSAAVDDGPPTTQDNEGLLGWIPLQVNPSTANSRAAAATTNSLGMAEGMTVEGDARADALIAGELFYAGNSARSVTLSIPYSLRAAVATHGAIAIAFVTATFAFAEGTAVDASEIVTASFFGTPAQSSGFLTLALNFDPSAGRARAIVNLLAFADVASPVQVPVPLPLPALLFGSALLGLVKYRPRITVGQSLHRLGSAAHQRAAANARGG